MMVESSPASPAGSPAGSPSTGPIDGAELARRMIVATEAASAVTELAARAWEQLKNANKKSSENRDWCKFMAKAGSCDPSSRDLNRWIARLEWSLGTIFREFVRSFYRGDSCDS